VPNGLFRQAAFVLQRRSRRWLSREAGIPRATLYYFERGIRPLPREYHRALRSVYQREAYSRLRELGISSREATRWSWYSPERVSTVTARWQELKTYLVGGAYRKLYVKYEREGIPFDPTELYERAEEAVTRGLIRRRTTIEDVEKYLEAWLAGIV